MPKSDLLKEIDGQLSTVGTSATLSVNTFDETAADVWLAGKTTDELNEGGGNLYLQPHDIGGSYHTGSLAHASLSGVGETDHHAALSGGNGITVTGWQAAIDPTDTITWTARQYFENGITASDAEIWGELHSAVFVKDLISAHAGELIVSKSAGTLDADYPVGGTLIVKDPPSGAVWLFDTGDVIRIKAEYNGGGVGDTWITVTRTATVNQYTTTRKSGTYLVTYPAGTGAVDYGASGDGFLTMNATDADAPFYDVATHTGAPYTSTDTHVRLGNLAGISDPDLTPTGYGLYADNVFLKGAIVAGNGDVVIDSDGMAIYDTTDTGIGNSVAGLEWFDRSNSDEYLGGIYGLNDTTLGEGVAVYGQRFYVNSQKINLSTEFGWGGTMYLPGAGIKIEGNEINVAADTLTLQFSTGVVSPTPAVFSGGQLDVGQGYKVNGTSGGIYVPFSARKYITDWQPKSVTATTYTIDLSSYVPSNAKAVYGFVTFLGSGAGRYVLFRQTITASNDDNICGVARQQASGIHVDGYFLAQLDSTHLSVQVQSDGTGTLYLSLLGYYI